VFPGKILPQHREHVYYDLCAANGTTLPTYGWLLLKLNLGLCQDFMWRFAVADVIHPFIGAHFLSYFGIKKPAIVNTEKRWEKLAVDNRLVLDTEIDWPTDSRS
jgi:hypothetical protein